MSTTTAVRNRGRRPYVQGCGAAITHQNDDINGINAIYGG